LLPIIERRLEDLKKSEKMLDKLAKSYDIY